jgi:hypothetical protein
MRNTTIIQLCALTTALCLPALAAAQFPYSAWTCARPGGEQVCSPAKIPSQGKSVLWGDTPDAPDVAAVQEPVNEQELNAFANVFSKIEAISQEFTKSLPANANADNTKSLREEAHRKALEAMKSANISLSDYNEIAAFSSKDAELRRRVIPSISQS